jgi:LEA14-like dessication related protein
MEKRSFNGGGNMNRETIGFFAKTALAVLLITSCGCKMIEQRKAIKECKFDLEKVEVKDVTLKDVSLIAYVGIENPNDDQVILDRIDFTLYSDKTKLADGSHRKQLKIQPGTREVTPVTVKAPLKNLGAGLLAAVTKSGDVTYTMTGTVYIDTWIGTIEYPLKISKKY